MFDNDAVMWRSVEDFDRSLTTAKRRWAELQESSWNSRELPKLKEDAMADLLQIKDFVDGHQGDLTKLEMQLQEVNEERAALDKAKTAQSDSMVQLSDELKTLKEAHLRTGTMIKQAKNECNEIERQERKLRALKRDTECATQIESVVFAHCTRVVNPEGSYKEEFVTFQPVDQDRVGNFKADVRSYEICPWEELAKYHGVNIGRRSEENVRPRSRGKRQVPTVGNTPPTLAQEEKRGRFSMLL